MTDVLPAILVASSDIPGRLSAVTDHPDYHPIWSPAVRQVFLDGLPVKDVMRFDTKEGWVEFHVRDAAGKFIRFEGTTGSYLATRRETGKVRASFRIPPEGGK